MRSKICAIVDEEVLVVPNIPAVCGNLPMLEGPKGLHDERVAIRVNTQQAGGAKEADVKGDKASPSGDFPSVSVIHWTPQPDLQHIIT